MTMKKFKSVEELINAKAMQTHKANLNYGGVFGAKGERISNLEFEKKHAATHLIHVGAEYAPIIIGKKLSKKASAAKYIKGIGYTEF